MKELDIDPSLERPPEFQTGGELYRDFSDRRAAWEASPAGQTWAGALEAARSKYFAEELGRQQRRLLDELDLPLKDVTIFTGGNLLETRAIKEIRSSTATIIVLAGPVGVGKTVAGSWWIWDFVHDWRNWKGRDDCKQFVPKKPVFVTATQLARASRYEDATMDRLLTASRLVIDDLGSEYSDAKGFFRSLLDEVVNVRYSMRRPLLITTNVGPEVFTERYGERIMDRLRECGAFTGIGGPSLRRKPQP